MVAFSMGRNTLVVPMKLFFKNRLRLCDSLAPLVCHKTFVFLQGASNTYRGETSDAERVFRQEQRYMIK